MAEENGRAALVLPELDCVDDAAVVDALQYLVLAAGGTFRGLAGRFGRPLTDQIDPDPALFLHEAVVANGETVLPGGTGIERMRAELPGIAEPQVPGGLPDPDGPQQLRQSLPGELGRDPPLRPVGGQAQEVLPDAVKATAAVVPPVHADALDLVQVADEVGRRQKHGRLDPRNDPLIHPELAGGPTQLAPELLRLEVVEVQRVVDGPRAVAAAEVPGGAGCCAALRGGS